MVPILSHKQMSQILFSLGSGLLAFIFLSILIPSLGFIVNIDITPLWLTLASVGSLAITYQMLRKWNIQHSILWALLLPVIIFSSTLIASVTFDASWDGNAYHKTAIGALKNGWNPVYENLDTFNASAENPVKIIHPYSEWNNHYPKASWIYAAGLYQITENIESGKSLLLLSSVVLFLFSLGFLYQKLGLNKSLLISLAAAGNPIAVLQFFSYYNDAILGNMILLSVILFTMLLERKPQIHHRLICLLIFFTLTITLNIKFTGLVYAGVYAVIYYVFILVNRGYRKKLALNLTVTGIVTLIVGLFVVGLSTYPKNFVENGNPFYPLFGGQAVDIITKSQPVSFSSNSRFENFIRANLSYTENINANGAKPTLKIPFSVRLDELSNMAYPDVRMGGYGVWFGGILLLSGILGLYLLVKYAHQYKRYLLIFLLPIIATLTLIVFLKEAWWARYLPQLVLLPLIVTTALFMVKKQTMPYLLISALLINSLFIGVSVINAQDSHRQQLTSYRQAISTCPQLKYIFADHLDGGIYNLIDTDPTLKIISPEKGRELTLGSPTQVWPGISSHQPCQ